ncbi:MAG TPA: hypothetical protein VGL81_19760 [Polyangiaceae bacterium]|jgi:hypothetical protein
MRWSALSHASRPGVRAKRFLAGGALAAALALVPLAFAQQPRWPQRAAGRPAAKPKASAGSDNPYETDKPSGASPATSAASSPASTANAAWPASSTGPVPPPPTESGDGGKLSPLNPAANEFSDAGLGSSSLDYDRLLADIGSLRARVAAVSDTLFHSRIAVTLETSGDHGRIAALSVSLDDGVVWTSPPQFRAEDATVVYDHAVAPGHHAVTIDVERRDDRNDTFRSAQRSRFVVDVPADQRLGVDVKLWDDSSMGGDFPGDKKGSYELRVRMRAKAQAIGR